MIRVQDEPSKGLKINAWFETSDGLVTGTQSVPIKTVRMSDDGSEVEVILDYWPPVEKSVNGLLKGLKPELYVVPYMDEDGGNPYCQMEIDSVSDGKYLQPEDAGEGGRIPMYTIGNIVDIILSNLRKD